MVMMLPCAFGETLQLKPILSFTEGMVLERIILVYVGIITYVKCLKDFKRMLMVNVINCLYLSTKTNIQYPSLAGVVRVP